MCDAEQHGLDHVSRRHPRLDNFTRVGDANWSATDGAIQATAGGKDNAYLVSKDSYGNFTIRVEFWASDDANSGVFCAARIAATSVTRPATRPTSSTSDPTRRMRPVRSLKSLAVAQPAPKVGGKWSVYEITANGPQLTVVLNGMKTVDVRDTKFVSGPIALQWGRGTIKFRKVEIKARLTS
jgi:hypothetical protein